MQYEILRESANGLEMPEGYSDAIAYATDYAIDLAHERAEGGYTGRAVVRNGYDEAVVYVRVRGPLTLIYTYHDGSDLPIATWNGRNFSYYDARYSSVRRNREFLKTSA